MRVRHGVKEAGPDADSSVNVYRDDSPPEKADTQNKLSTSSFGLGKRDRFDCVSFFFKKYCLS